VAQKFSSFLSVISMSMSDDIIDAVRQNSGLTAMEITVQVFGRRHPYKQRVNHECRGLVEAGKLQRCGKGGPGKPFTYFLGPVRNDAAKQ
jgi:hypothetical protein